ncbi:MAG TPA: peptidase M56, partial [Clostridiaceae bacterium]|nr:peptidase M56 [Clostridiaceae bacterium]
MWHELLPQIINMSITGGIVIIVVLLIRLLLKRAPKVFSYALWVVVLFRLLCPLALPSSISIFTLFDAPRTHYGSLEYIPEDIVQNENPIGSLPMADVNESVNSALLHGQEQVVADSPEPMPAMSAATYIWLVGVTALLLYSVIKLFRLRRKLIGSCLLRENIYLADHIASPFVIGIFRPSIYLPSTLSDREREYIILHEQHHIRRFDHIVKLLAFL